MKTLADLKRKIIVGTKLQLEHLESAWAPPIREVCFVGSTKFGCKTINNKGEIVTSYVDFPKASDLEIIDDNTFIFWALWFKDGKEQRIPLLKYTIIQG
jgi:hypothetical protein